MLVNNSNLFPLDGFSIISNTCNLLVLQPFKGMTISLKIFIERMVQKTVKTSIYINMGVNTVLW